MNTALLNIELAWLLVLGGILSGAVSGLCFHQENWLGGYASFRRRLVRLGHISFFGLSILNMMFAGSVFLMQVPQENVQLGSTMFIIAGITMPLACFLNAWRARFRPLFAVPVISLTLGVIQLLCA